MAKLNKKVCLTIDRTGQNSNGSGKYRSNADKPDFQTCYFNVRSDEQIYNTFLSRRLKDNEFKNSIHFRIEKIRSKTCGDIFDAKFELENLKNDTANGKFSKPDGTINFEQSNSTDNKFYGSGGTTTTQQQPSDLEILDQNFYMGINVDQKKKETAIVIKQRKKYGATKVKAQNFLTNVSYKTLTT